MNCLSVREQLPEFAVGVLPPEQRAAVERHLQWCAGCRKEAGDLGDAAAAFAMTLPPAEPSPGLGDRVVAAVRRAAGTPGTRRRLRAAVASTVAAMVAVAGLGWGAVMAGRAERFADRAAQAEQQRVTSLERFRKVLSGLDISPLPDDRTFFGQIAPPTSEGQGGGAVLQLVSPRMFDFVIVIVNGLDVQDRSAVPYRVVLRNAEGQTLQAGKIVTLDKDGGAEVFHEFRDRDLTGYATVLVKDATGDVVLRGTVDQSPAAG